MLIHLIIRATIHDRITSSTLCLRRIACVLWRDDTVLQFCCIRKYATNTMQYMTNTYIILCFNTGQKAPQYGAETTLCRSRERLEVSPAFDLCARDTGRKSTGRPRPWTENDEQFVSGARQVGAASAQRATAGEKPHLT